MNLLARLEEAMDAAHRGEHERALREYRWLHDYALDHDPAFCGVRLSFALAAWVELAEAYPPARDALLRIRDAKTQQLLQGEGSRATFEDVEAINSYLDDQRATYELFRQLREVEPRVADASADLAWESAAAFGDFALARACIDDPSTWLRTWTGGLNADIPFIRADARGPFPELEATTSAMFAERVALLLQVLTNVGEDTAAVALRTGVFDAIEDQSVRNQVREHLG